MKNIHYHFSNIAHQYEYLRTTDLEPILFIRKKLKNLTKINAADIGCGVGRYDIKLFQHLGKKLHLACIDHNDDMLNELNKNFQGRKIENYKSIRASAMALPLEINSLDAIFTFNAVHHFKLLDFLREACRVLKNRSHLFIYTRLRSQNKRNIWGRFFPEFYQREKHLYELSELRKTLKRIPILILESIEYFKYRRTAKLERLISQASDHHYSTFYFYNKKEFGESLKKFQENITRHFQDLNRITWDDENILLAIRNNG
ncbi:MAG: class I SAM-dependent methyltransferase [Deltaproteobacteria bacterium]|nr:MAG: class I SAM-dependent methyltransferase [Deltaproteobacteria bacterium]